MTRVGGLSYGWVIVAAGALMTCVSIGSMFSLAVFLQPMSADTGWSRTGISTAMTLDFLAMGFAAFGWGALSDRFGARIVVLSGGLLLGLGLVLASRATTPARVPAHVRPARRRGRRRLLCADDGGRAGWFEHNRSLAVALVSAGMGVAPLTDVAVRALADHDLRLAPGDAGGRHRGRIAAGSGGAAGAPPAGRARPRPAAPGVATPVAAIVPSRA